MIFNLCLYLLAKWHVCTYCVYVFDLCTYTYIYICVCAYLPRIHISTLSTTFLSEWFITPQTGIHSCPSCKHAPLTKMKNRRQKTMTFSSPHQPISTNRIAKFFGGRPPTSMEPIRVPAPTRWRWPCAMPRRCWRERFKSQHLGIPVKPQSLPVRSPFIPETQG